MRLTLPRTNQALFFGLLRSAGLLCAVLQLFIEPTIQNTEVTLLNLISSLILLEYLYRTNTVTHFPISFIAMLGLCLMSQYVSLLAQTVSWRSLDYMLRAPVDTFAVLAAVQLIAVGAHWLYRRARVLQDTRTFLAERVIAPLGGFSIPSPGSIWTMAFFGALSLFAGGAETGNVGGKIFQALAFFAWFPFLIPIYFKKYGNRYCSIGGHLIALVVYILLLVVIGMARNARQFMLIGPMQAAFMFLIMSLQSDKQIGSGTYKKLALLLLLGMIGLQLVGDLATAMVLVRNQRQTASYADMVEETLSALADRRRLDLYRNEAFVDAKTSGYDEVYLENPVLARLSETKFHDNMIYFSGQLSDSGRADLRSLLWAKTIAIFPQNILRRVGIRMDKDRYIYSGGDVYRFVNGQVFSLGSFSTGSIWADLINLFGYLSPVVAFVMLLVCFVVLDSFSRWQPDIVNISIVMLCSTWPIYGHGLGAESVAAKVQFLVRDIPQSLVLFLVFYWGLRLMTRKAERINGVYVPLKPLVGR